MVLRNVLIAALLALGLVSCAGNMYEVKSLDEVENMVKQQWAKELSSSTGATAVSQDKVGSPVAGDVALVGTELSFFGFQHLEATKAIFKPTLPSSNMVMGWFTALDMLKLIHDIKEQEKYRNAIGVRVKFKHDIIYSKTDQDSKVSWFVFPKEQKAPCNKWKIGIHTDPDDNLKVYTVPSEPGKEKLVKVDSDKGPVYMVSAKGQILVSRGFKVFLWYDESVKGLPDEDICSMKNAEAFLANYTRAVIENISKQLL
jgi:hypothetical protein